MFAYDPADAIAIPKFHYYSFASFNLEWHLFFWYWLTQVVLKKDAILWVFNFFSVILMQLTPKTRPLGITADCSATFTNVSTLFITNVGLQCLPYFFSLSFAVSSALL